jgi:hypothetical protein
MKKKAKYEVAEFVELFGTAEEEIGPELEDLEMNELEERRDRNAHLLLTAWRTLLEEEARELELKRLEAEGGGKAVHLLRR